jgi:hypothetical protein
MNSEMAFECLLLSSDPGVLREVNSALTELSVSTRICFHASQAERAIAEGGVDLLIIDVEHESSAELLRAFWKSGPKEKPTIVAISHMDRNVPGAHLRMLKPLNAETARKIVKEAYARMLVDYRRKARHALMTQTTATDDCNNPIAITVMDIGYGGVGLRLQKELTIGQVLTFRLELPGARKEIHIEARVLWTRDFGRTGCEFVRIPPVDLDVLHDWLKEKIRVKQPSVLTAVL